MLRLDLQFFSEEDESLDFDSMLEEFENEWSDDTEETEETTDEVEDVEGEDQTEDTEEDSTVEEDPETEEKPPVEDDDKRNRAFADLRRQADENRKYAEFVAKLAEDSGLKPEDVLARYQERQLEEKSKETGVPVEFLKRQTETETRLGEVETQLVAARLDAQIQNVIATYGATEADIQATFEEMLRSGVDPRTNQNVNFESFYKSANLDKIIEAKVNEAKQSSLSAKKKRQEQAALPNGSSVSQPSDELSDEEVDRLLAQMDIRL